MSDKWPSKDLTAFRTVINGYLLDCWVRKESDWNKIRSTFSQIDYIMTPSNKSLFLSYISKTSESKVPEKHASAAQLLYRLVLV